MRKLLWGAIALMVCASAGIYLLARYAARHPDTFYHRTVQVTRESRTSRAAVPEAGPQFPPDLPITVRGSSDWAPPEAPPDLATAMRGSSVPPEVPEVVESIVIENRDEGVTPAVYQFRTGPIFVAGGQETTEPPILLQPVRVPEYMPYADEESPARCGSWFGWLSDDHDGMGETFSCPGWCTWIADLIGELWHVMYGPAQPSTDGAAEPLDWPRLEQPQEIRPPFGLPNFREDPNYHHHYPSCPYTGGCPYPHHYRLMQPVQPVRPVQPTPPAAPTPPAVPTPNGSEASRSMPAPRLPAHSHLDTLECRPSDLPAGPQNRPF